MGVFAQKPRAPRQTAFSMTDRARLGQGLEASLIPHARSTIGDRAAQRLTADDASRVSGVSTAAGVAPFSHDFGRVPVHAPGQLPSIERRGQTGQHVRYGSEGHTPAARSASGAASRSSPLMIQRAAAAQSAHGDGEAAAPLGQAIERARGSGRAMEGRLRGEMESAFGADFGGVRVHTDVEADAMNTLLSARAFTQSQDIFFRRGEYAPDRSKGRELLAHELTHVIQQGAHPSPQTSPLYVSEPRDRSEREADRAATTIMAEAEETRRSAVRGGVGETGRDDHPNAPLVARGEGAAPHTRISRLSVPCVQRTATFDPGTVTTWDPAFQAVEKRGSMGQTLYRLNGDLVYSAASLSAAIESPVISRRTTSTGEDCWINSARKNVASFLMFVPNSGPWRNSPLMEKVGRLLDLPVCMRQGYTKFRVRGVPSDAAAATKIRTHEEVHANYYKDAFDSIVGPWDRAITTAEGRVFSGPDAAACEAKLFAAVGGTPDEIAASMYRLFGPLDKAFHRSTAGRVVGVTNGGSNDSCTVSWGYFGP